MTELTGFQQRVMAMPEDLDAFLGGGRGGGKSFTLALVALRHAEEYGPRARILYIRQSHQGLRDFESTCLDVFGSLGTLNSQQGLFKFANGAVLEFNQIDSVQQLQKFVGRSFTLLLADECGEWADPALIDRLRGNLRSGSGVPCRVVLAANPGGPGHQWLCRRHVNGREPWVPYVESQTGATFISCPSTLVDNDYLDESYRRQIEAATATDLELRKAWLHGDWHIARGAFFADVIDEERNSVDWTPEVWREFVEHEKALDYGEPELYLSYDHGISHVAVGFLCWQSDGRRGPDGEFYPADSVILLDEWDSTDGHNLNEGLPYVVSDIAHELKRMCRLWRAPARGVADDAIDNRTGRTDGITILKDFAEHGVRFQTARKGLRPHGWNRMRQMLHDARSFDDPGLFVSKRCVNWWATVPSLARHPTKIDDVHKRAGDDWADACRYALNGYGGGVAAFSTVGVFGR